MLEMKSWVPCQSHLLNVPSLTKESCLNRMLIERLESKTEYFRSLHLRQQGDWEEVLHISLARSFGFQANGPPMERLAQHIPLKLLRSIRDDTNAVEALFFGLAGLLNKVFIDAYPVALQKHFSHLAVKHRLHGMDQKSWAWGGMRPANFPTIRIAQFVKLNLDAEHLMRQIVDANELGTIHELLSTSTSEYWLNHSDFDKPSKKRTKSMGSASVNSVLVNTICPFLFIYGKYRGDEQLCERAIDFYMEIPAEKHRITRGWADFGMPNAHAGHSQALIHLKKVYCDHHRCAACSIGNDILTKPETAYG